MRWLVAAVLSLRCALPLAWVGQRGLAAPRRLASLQAQKGGASSDELLIVGCGYLGVRVASRWTAAYGKVVGETRSTKLHADIAAAGASPRLRDQRDGAKYPYVLFCAPPGANQDEYAEQVAAAAADCWDGTGAFVFTSSGAVYSESAGGRVDEDSALAFTPRSTVLIAAEYACVKADGCVLRLAGLYSLERGPHSYWLKQTSVDARPDGVVNLLHYDDAATASIAALRKGETQETWLVSDGSPITREAICAAAVKAARYAGTAPPAFTGAAPQPLGRIYDDAVTRADLAWAPEFASFDKFIDSLA
ncbi:hypothetical protein M885DRAFT_507162 [Pelagophyceae sp. CCMP2097]|nr:hypothetical protein M885DRAFT_507162 [Pelagophyceae sp. CCMP2097]